MNLKAAILISALLAGSITGNIIQFGQNRDLKAEIYKKTLMIEKLAD
jgi:hypothetical protein